VTDDNPYVGTELELFATATTWRRYWHSFVAPFLRGEVLEVGAGRGANLGLSRTRAVRRWVCVEPDGAFRERLRKEVERFEARQTCYVVTGTVEDLPQREAFDAVLYFDVLEHIYDDAAELRRAAIRLRAGGVLVILAPAHPWLYTAFDAAIGHYRRYTKTTLVKVVPSGLNRQLLVYLDCFGLVASMANRVLLRQESPTSRQILFWDRVLVRASGAVDPFFRYSLGKSLLGVWRKPAS
jgi:SAM-dependent methyltransferase